jgi:hypothetical protein
MRGPPGSPCAMTFPDFYRILGVPRSADACDRTGRIESEGAIRVRIPPMVRDGTVIDVPLEQIGIRNMYLRVHVAIRRDIPIW